MLMRRRGIGLLGAAAIGGTAYAVGSGRSRNKYEMRSLEQQQQQLADQQQDMYSQQQAMAQQAYRQSQPTASGTLTQEQKIAQLQQLASLKQSGVLTDAEFEREKQNILQQ